MEPIFQGVEAAMGFVPNSMLTMAHWPELLQSFGGFAGGIINGGELERSLKQLIAFVVSNAAGCRYCQAHTSHGAEVNGVSPEKIQAAFEFETSALFTEPEKAALRVALHAGMVPNAVEPETYGCPQGTLFRQTVCRGCRGHFVIWFSKPMERHHGDDPRR